MLEFHKLTVVKTQKYNPLFNDPLINPPITWFIRVLLNDREIIQ